MLSRYNRRRTRAGSLLPVVHASLPHTHTYTRFFVRAPRTWCARGRLGRDPSLSERSGDGPRPARVTPGLGETKADADQTRGAR
eukprot:gene17432-biopygen806